MRPAVLGGVRAGFISVTSHGIASVGVGGECDGVLRPVIPPHRVANPAQPFDRSYARATGAGGAGLICSI